QTATAEVLNIISRSTFDAQPVFETIIKNAARLCQSVLSAIYRSDGELVHLAAHDQFSPESVAAVRAAYPVPITSSNLIAVAVRERRVVHIPDVLVSGGYTELQRTSGYRGILIVPMMRDDVAIGAIAVMQIEPRLFPDTQVELLKTFASQAVLAIDNVRMFEEVQARTREVQESLEYQTAISDVLNVISRSPNELQPVIDAILQTAARLCEAEYALFWRLQDGAYHLAGASNADAAFVKHCAEHPIRPGRGSVAGRTALEQKTVHLPDCLADPEYTLLDFQEVGGHRSMLGVPLLRDGVTIAIIVLLRNAVRPFTDKQIDLVTTFANQALIAIENVRLFDEVQARTRDLSESLEQQTATAEVLQVISSSPGEPQPVFEAMLANATRLCEAKFGTLYTYDGNGFHAAAFHNAPPAYVEARTREPVLRPPPDTPVGRIAATRQLVQIADIKTIPSYIEGHRFVRAAVDLAGYRTVLAVPMLKEAELVGAIVIYRQEVRLFTQKQIELVTNFATQAVIAIENTRLLNELRESLEQQTATSEVL
ncbi:MAG TPA: GAF domain-containing protein, partial [Bradyrhizobium sp.]|nr:GAF domain-containing protein [Bradyrhizobium sp.]